MAGCGAVCSVQDVWARAEAFAERTVSWMAPERWRIGAEPAPLKESGVWSEARKAETWLKRKLGKGSYDSKWQMDTCCSVIDGRTLSFFPRNSFSLKFASVSSAFKLD